MFAKVIGFLSKERKMFIGKAAKTEIRVALYFFYFILAASVFVMLNISFSILLFRVMLNYVDVYALLVLSYLLLLMAVLFLKKRILKSLKVFIKYCLLQKDEL